jgi:hypothetical protein
MGAQQQPFESDYRKSVISLQANACMCLEICKKNSLLENLNTTTIRDQLLIFTGAVQMCV